jgi:hypothetical protein
LLDDARRLTIAADDWRAFSLVGCATTGVAAKSGGNRAIRLSFRERGGLSPSTRQQPARSFRQFEANRRNARLSTGPVTQEGNELPLLSAVQVPFQKNRHSNPQESRDVKLRQSGNGIADQLYRRV